MRFHTFSEVTYLLHDEEEESGLIFYLTCGETFSEGTTRLQVGAVSGEQE